MVLNAVYCFVFNKVLLVVMQYLLLLEWGLPCLLDVMTVNCVLLRLRILQTDPRYQQDPAPPQLLEFLPDLLDLVETVFQCCR